MEKDLKIIENPQLFHGWYILYLIRFSLHFRYNHKKYLYGLSEQLLTFGQQNGLLYKINGTYEPTQRQKKEKSTLQLKKEKIIMKIDYIILPRKACSYQYLWHFDNIFEKINCRNFVILNQSKEEKENMIKDQLLKQQLTSLLNKSHNNDPKLNLLIPEYKIQMFKQHSNALKKQKVNLEHHSAVDQIYEQEINDLILQMFRKDSKQYAQKSIFNHLDPQQLTKQITALHNDITNNQFLEKNLQLTSEQLTFKKQQFSRQILRISSSENVIYPTQSQELQIIFLPSTLMIMLLHKHHIALINPSNLTSWRLHHLSLPVWKVKQIILTRFSMTFVEFILQWSVIGKQQKVHSFLEVITLDWIYKQIKKKLSELFLWDDDMIRSKMAFRVIPSSSKNIFTSNSRHNGPEQQFYTLGYLRLCYQNDSIKQQSWIIKFGDKSVLLLNELVLFNQEWLKRFDFVIFDKVKQEKKQYLYKQSQSNKEISIKCIYNRSSVSKYRHKHLYFLHEQNPIIRVRSQIKMQETFVPYYKTNQNQKERYKKVRLSPGQCMDHLDNNVIVVEGLIGVLNEVNLESKNWENKNKVPRQTQLWLYYYPVDFIQSGGAWSSINLHKIRKVKQLIALKESLLLVEKLEDQQSYETYPIDICQLQISKLLSNSLIKQLSSYSTNFHLSYHPTHQIEQKLVKQKVYISSPLWLFSRLFKKVTLKQGQYINQDNQKVYFVIEGSLKWKNHQGSQLIANNKAFIGDLKYFYQAKLINQPSKDKYYEQNSKKEHKQHKIFSIEVIKSTQVLEGDLNQLHSIFFSQYPEVSYWIITKGLIFY